MATIKGTKGNGAGEKAGHDRRGRFTKGNKCATGRKVTDLRRALLDAVTVEDMAAIAERLIAAAKSGDLDATALLFDRVLGKPMTTQETELYTHEYDKEEEDVENPLLYDAWGNKRDQIRPLSL